MRILTSEDLRDGMVIGVDLYFDENLIVKKGTVLTNDYIDYITKSIPKTNKVWVLDLVELKPSLLKNTIFARKYISFLIQTFRNIFTTVITDGTIVDSMLESLHKYFFNNRALLYEAVALRSNHCYTYEHSINVAMYALLIGLKEELTSEELENLVLGCILHDLGKINISSRILDKPYHLSTEEFKAIRQHPLYGVEIYSNTSITRPEVVKIIIQHHEKLDGTGYPYGLVDEQISHLAKITTVADIFDAVTSKRAYHEKRSVLDGINILNGDSLSGRIGSDEVSFLTDSLIIFPINTIVELNNGVSGLVVDSGIGFSPIVMGYDNRIYDLTEKRNLNVVRTI